MDTQKICNEAWQRRTLKHCQVQSGSDTYEIAFCIADNISVDKIIAKNYWKEKKIFFVKDWFCTPDYSIYLEKWTEVIRY